LSRRLFSRPKPGSSLRVAGPGGGAEAVVSDATSRRAFLAGGGAAVGTAAVVLATPRVVALAGEAPGSSVPVEPAPRAVKQTGAAPREPVTAYVRNAETGEVTVMAGQQETTYTDPVLVKRLLDAAR
jgi:hypothetical protein